MRRMDVTFVESTSQTSGSDGRWGAYPMTAVPEVGETVQLDGADWVVESRLWRPKRLSSAVNVTVQRSSSLEVR